MKASAASAGGFYPGPRRRGVSWALLGGVVVALLGHLLLFAALSLLWKAPPPVPPQTKPVEVSLVDDVALESRSPPAIEPPAQSRAPEQGAPEDAPPPAPAEQQAADPTPPKPQPDAVPPPKPAPKPAPAPKKPIAEKPDKPVKTRAPAAKAATTPTKADAATKTSGSSARSKQAKPTGSLLDADFRKGLTQSPSNSKADVPPAATMTGAAAADIASAIKRQVQPCADQQINPGPGASRIIVSIRLQLNRDGSLATRPTVADDHGGVDDDNRRYVDAVDRNAIKTFTQCAPLRDLPPDLYAVPHGWKTFTLRYKLPG